MTPEEAAQLYRIEERKFYDYCTYIVSYQNKIGEYQSERQNKCVQVENKQIEIQKNRELLEAISGTTGVHDDLFSHLTKINSKVEDAALNFKTMVSSSTVSSFDLSNAFGEKATSANSQLTAVFDAISKGASTVAGVIETLNQELQALNARIQELGSEISKAQAMIDQYEASKRSCLANMAYYKKIIAAAAPAVPVVLAAP